MLTINQMTKEKDITIIDKIDIQSKNRNILCSLCPLLMQSEVYIACTMQWFVKLILESFYFEGPRCCPEERHNTNISDHQVLSNGKPCLMFQARRLSLRYERQKLLDLTEQAFSPQKPVDTSQSVCSKDKATYVHQWLICLPVCLMYTAR